jgi:lipid-binding SYLF domain-containing protein
MLTVCKLGFFFSGVYGTGLVVSKLGNGLWSAPSAIQMSGLGWGLQAGVEVSEVLLVLTNEKMLEMFMSGGSLNLNTEIEVSVGYFGHTTGTKGIINTSTAAVNVVSYALSQGLFVGISLEACAVQACPKTNEVR